MPLRPWVTAAVVSVLLAVVVSLAFRPESIPARAESPNASPPTLAERPAAAAPAGARRPVIFYTGEQRGYLEPCGCSKPMIGGIARRARYLANLPPEIAALKV